MPLTTDRLSLLPFTLADAAFVLELLSSEPWLRYIGERGVKTLAQAEAYLRQKVLPEYSASNKGRGAYRISRRSDGVALGMLGLYQRDFLVHPDLGFALLPWACGQGYAYEASTALLQHLSTRYGLTHCCAITTADNRRSQALLFKLGFVAAGVVETPEEGTNETETLNYYHWAGTLAKL